MYYVSDFAMWNVDLHTWTLYICVSDHRCMKNGWMDVILTLILTLLRTKKGPKNLSVFKCVSLRLAVLRKKKKRRSKYLSTHFVKKKLKEQRIQPLNNPQPAGGASPKWFKAY